MTGTRRSSSRFPQNRFEAAGYRLPAGRVEEMRRSAEERRCPRCGRKAALVVVEEVGEYCRWGESGKCNYARVIEPVG